MISVNYKSEIDCGIKEEIEIEIDTGKVEKIFATQFVYIVYIFMWED